MHRDAFEKAGVLHRDVSLFNLLFVLIAAAANSNLGGSEGEELVGKRTTDFLNDSGLEEEKRIELSKHKITARITRRGLLADWGYSIPNQSRGPNELQDVQLPSSNSSPTVYVRSPSSNSETKTKSLSDLECKDNIVIPLFNESLPDDSDVPIDANPLHRTVCPKSCG